MIALSLAVSIFFTACGASTPVTPKTLVEDEKACYEFVQSHMLVEGGMLTNFHKKPPSVELATGNEVLSESQGLLLGYTAAIADRAAFDEVYAFTKEKLDNGKVFAYRYNPAASETNEYTVNAAVDDLRIIKALYRAGEVFSDKSLVREAKNYADRFYESNVEQDQLYDFYDTELFMKNNFITLCYLDLDALGLLAQTDKRYGAVYEKSIDILKGGYLGGSFPLFMTRYNYATGKYEAENGINMIEAVLTALNLAYAENCPVSTVDYLKKELDKGRIYARYKLDGTPLDTFESTAVYALCALLAQELGDEQMYEKSITLMKRFMVRKKDSPLYGAFGDENNVFSFDNLMALTAFRSGVKN